MVSSYLFVGIYNAPYFYVKEIYIKFFYTVIYIYFWPQLINDPLKVLGSTRPDFL